MARPRRAEPTVMINVRVSQEFMERLQAAAYHLTGKLSPNISEFVRQILQNYLSQFSEPELEAMKKRYQQAVIDSLRQRIHFLEQS